MISNDDTPLDRLATTSQDGSRVYIYLSDVFGKFRTLRNYFYDFLIIIFLTLPWIRIQGAPVLLFDIPNRKFHIFGLSFWGHEAPILFIILLILVVTIMLITALFGRVWCGWACPQTVFIDRVYRRIERWIEGNSAQQMKLVKSPWTLYKLFKRVLKWFCFAIVSLIITHSFLSYFVGSSSVLEMIQQPPQESPVAFIIILITTFLVFFDFVWFREQFCIIACPYGRFQSVLMDEHSLTVAYDEKRGEPRKQSGNKNTSFGDCVDCHRCIQVCPTGIDIRRGIQMECIACTACIDACDTIMEKLKKPKGLIRYDTEQGLKNQKTLWIRLRIILYAVVLSGAIITLSYIISHRELLKINVVRSKDNPYQILQNGERLINHFKLNVRNQYDFPIYISFKISPHSMKSKNIVLTIPIMPLKLDQQQSIRTDLFISFDSDLLDLGQKNLSIQAFVKKNNDSNKIITTLNYEVPLIAPNTLSAPSTR